MHLPPSRFGAPIIKPSLYRLILKSHFLQAVIRNGGSCRIFPHNLCWRRGKRRERARPSQTARSDGGEMF